MVYARKRDARIAAYRKEHGVTNDVEGVLRKKGFSMPQCPQCGGLGLWVGDNQDEIMCLAKDTPAAVMPTEPCDECGEPGVWMCATCGQPGYVCERLPDDGLDHSSGWSTCYSHRRKG